jgi:hypothetical protein
MSEFSVDQKWVMADPIFGIFYGEVAEVSDDGLSGTVVITDGEGNELDTFIGKAAEFRGEWQLVERGLLRYRQRRAATSIIPKTRPCKSGQPPIVPGGMLGLVQTDRLRG